MTIRSLFPTKFSRPTPTRWRCVTCGAANTTVSRCGHPTPWETFDARNVAECRGFEESKHEKSP